MPLEVREEVLGSQVDDEGGEGPRLVEGVVDEKTTWSQKERERERERERDRQTKAEREMNKETGRKYRERDRERKMGRERDNQIRKRKTEESEVIRVEDGHL